MNANPFKSYIRFVLGIGGLTTLAMFAYAMLNGHLSANFWIFRCNASGYSDEYYLGFCSDPAFGSYEHGAFYFGLDETNIANLQLSKVLFLGNSRAKKAFSAKTFVDFFSQRGVKYFNFAFAGETDVFPKIIIEKHDVRPKVVVASADYFFYGTANVFAREILSNTPQTKLEYSLKNWIQPFHEKICSAGGHPLKNLICGNRETQYRSRINGRVFSPNWPEDKKLSLEYTGEYPSQIVPQLLKNARSFKEFLAERNACLVITVVPSPLASPEVGREIARVLDVPFVLPIAKNIFSYDGSHMDTDSAEIWSAAFLESFQPVMEKCLGGS